MWFCGDFLDLNGDLAGIVVKAEIRNLDALKPAHREIGEVRFAGN